MLRTDSSVQKLRSSSIVDKMTLTVSRLWSFQIFNIQYVFNSLLVFENQSQKLKAGKNLHCFDIFVYKLLYTHGNKMAADQ